MKANTPGKQPLYPLIGYLSILVQEYPHPIRAVKLAERTTYTKAAVSKVRQRLMTVCDINRMVFDKGFVLRADMETFVNIFTSFVSRGKQQEFLSSNYAKTFLKSDLVYSELRSNWPMFAKYFTQEDTDFLIDKVLETISSINGNYLRQLFRGLLKSTGPDFGHIYASVIKIIESIQLPITSQHDLEMILGVRDKLFFLIRDILWQVTNDLSILKAKTEEERKTYSSVYEGTIDFYLRKIFEEINKMLVKTAREKGFPFPMELMQIGSTFLREHRI